VVIFFDFEQENERKGGKEKKQGKKETKKREGDGFTGVQERGY